MEETKALKQIPIFQHLSPRRLEGMLAVARVAHYEKGVTLFHQGTRAKEVWIVLEGWVHLVRSGGDTSHAVVLFTVTPNDVLCGISAIEEGTYHLSGVAGTACHVVRIPGEVFQEALTHEPKFAYHTLRLYAHRLQHIAQQYGSMAEPVSHRIVRTLLRLQQQFGTTLPVTHRELAQMSWTTTESAIRVVRRLKQQRYLTGTRGRVLITHPRALEQLLSHPTNGHHTI